ncbi:MAG: hypothetical protein FJ316_08625 [SAR202 cluster bacterium]|nr:hypothetical protein [SAR202 cluster bacterium]
MTDSVPEQFRVLFAQEMLRPEEDIQLDRAALYLAGQFCPEMELEQHLKRLEGLAEQVKAAVSPEASPGHWAEALSHVLFRQAGLRGNTEDYYNPGNSYINRVLETGLGIPITLSVIYMEVARRLGISCSGIGLPGHFIVGLPDLDLYVDPFHQGNLLSAMDCRRLIKEMFGERLSWQPEFLAPCTKREILFRMLTNLKQIFVSGDQYPLVIATLQQMTVVHPEQASLYKELAWCHLRLQQPRSALKCLERFQELASPSDHPEQVVQQLHLLRAALESSG